MAKPNNQTASWVCLQHSQKIQKQSLIRNSASPWAIQVKRQPHEIIKIKRKRNNSSLIQLSTFLPLASKKWEYILLFLVNIFYTLLHYSYNKKSVDEDRNSFIENRCFTVHIFWLSLTYSHSTFTIQIHFLLCFPAWSLRAIITGISYLKSRKGEHTIFSTKKIYMKEISQSLSSTAARAWTIQL